MIKPGGDLDARGKLRRSLSRDRIGRLSEVQHLIGMTPESANKLMKEINRLEGKYCIDRFEGNGASSSSSAAREVGVLSKKSGEVKRAEKYREQRTKREFREKRQREN